MNNKGADQTAWMRRLIWAFVVHIWHKEFFSWRGSNYCKLPPIKCRECIECKYYHYSVSTHFMEHEQMYSIHSAHWFCWILTCKRLKRVPCYSSSSKGWYTLKWAMACENLFIPYANNKGADQPARPRSLISAFVVRCLDSIVSILD